MAASAEEGASFSPVFKARDVHYLCKVAVVHAYEPVLQAVLHVADGLELAAHVEQADGNAVVVLRVKHDRRPELRTKFDVHAAAPEHKQAHEAYEVDGDGDRDEHDDGRG